MHKYASHRKVSGWVGFIPLSASIIMLAAVFTPLASAQAASVSFFLDQSNKLPDGVDYLSVMLTESEGGVDVLVKTLDPLNSIANDHFGIQKFGFGLSNGVFEEIENLPDGWRVKYNKRMDGFGRFDFRLQGRGWARTDELSFTVGGVGLGDFDSLFAAHVAGFEWCKIDDERHGERHKRCGGKDCLTSAYFAGSMPASTPVPLPAAVWLFGSGLMGLAGIGRRRLK